MVVVLCQEHLGVYAEKMVCRKKERFNIRDVLMDNPRGLMGISRMDRMSNARIRKQYGVAKG